MNTKNDETTQPTDIYEALERLRNTVDGLNARWGFMPEDEFRAPLAAILTDELGFRVERYQGYDDSGSIYGHPDQVEMDVIIRNGVVIAIEIKSSISRGDLALFQRKITFFESTDNVQTDRKVVISPFIDSTAVALAQHLGIELYSHSTELIST